MKLPVLCLIGVMSALMGCAAAEKPKRFTVFPPEIQQAAAIHPQKVLPYSGVRVRMAKDLRAYNTPLCFKADGTVQPYRKLAYYAPLELALERALQDVTTFEKTLPTLLTLEVRDYCLLETPTQTLIRVTLVFRLPGTAPVTQTATLPLPDAYTPAIARDYFAQALLQAWQAYTPVQD